MPQAKQLFQIAFIPVATPAAVLVTARAVREYNDQDNEGLEQLQERYEAREHRHRRERAEMTAQRLMKRGSRIERGAYREA